MEQDFGRLADAGDGPHAADDVRLDGDAGEGARVLAHALRRNGHRAQTSPPLMPQYGFAHEDVDLHRGADEGALRRVPAWPCRPKGRVARAQRGAIRGPPALLGPAVDEALGRLADGADAALLPRLDVERTT